MKYIGKWSVWVMVLWLGTVQAQQCWIPDSANAAGAPSFLAVITGNYPRPSATTWDGLAHYPQHAAFAQALRLLHSGNAAESLQQLKPEFSTGQPDSLLDATAALDRVTHLEVAALAAMVDGKWAEAQALIQRAQRFRGMDFLCRLQVEPLVISYFQQYGTEAPLFPHFNGGFYNFLQDSLGWEKTPNPDAYIVALNTVSLLYRLDPKRQVLYLELLGDLLCKEPNRFTANYIAALAYLRAGQIAGGAAEAVYDRKAIFALEAPRQAEERFNQYRFTQLKKTLQADADSATATPLKAMDPLAAFGGLFTMHLSTAAYLESDPGQLPRVLSKSKAQLAARETEFKRYAGDVDLKKEVKKDSRFNAFALLLILTIVGAVVFIWTRVRRASR